MDIGPSVFGPARLKRFYKAADNFQACILQGTQHNLGAQGTFQ
jgi:hypothetical protein